MDALMGRQSLPAPSGSDGTMHHRIAGTSTCPVCNIAVPIPPISAPAP